jgi:hypothetical protein
MFGPKIGDARVSGWKKSVKFMIFVHHINVLEKFIGYLHSSGAKMLKTGE